MDYFKIPKDYKSVLEPLLKKNFPDRYYFFDLKHHNDSRYIQLSTCIDDRDIHYELIKGYVELHLERKYSNYEYNDLWRELVEVSGDYPELSWHRWQSRNQGRCRYNVKVNNAQDIIDAFSKMSSIFDPVLIKYSKVEDTFVEESINTNFMLQSPDLMKVTSLKHSVVRIADIPFENLVIPEYQRPYKWNAKNVNQLINDIIAFRDCSQYRLGTLVLNENKIVDGQQRIVTLSLILYVLFNKQEIADNSPYNKVRYAINVFWHRTKFKNAYSIANVRDNLLAIRDRLEDLNADFLKFLLENCQFVMVQLPEISEAFQFFDSQNARGKDLEPHDLLKAFHLREIPSLSYTDSENITRWQDMSTNHLSKLFLAMFRVKRWVKSNKAQVFTKDNVGVFKGISLDSKRYPYYLQQIICNYFMDAYNNDVMRKIDRASMEFPYQLDQECINGSRFFDMVKHYDALYSKVTCCEVFREYDSEKDERSAYKIISLLDSYTDKPKPRVGDIFVRQLFDCLLTYYVDRFGFENINKVVRKLFRYVYRLRLKNFSVHLTTIDNEAKDGIMFRAIRDAKTSYDVINQELPVLNEVARNADVKLLNLYRSYE